MLQVFSQARSAAPAVLFIDEIDAVVGKRGAGDSVGGGAHERVLATLLNEMDGVGVRHDSAFTSRVHSTAAAAAGHSHQATVMLGEVCRKENVDDLSRCLVTVTRPETRVWGISIVHLCRRTPTRRRKLPVL